MPRSHLRPVATGRAAPLWALALVFVSGCGANEGVGEVSVVAPPGDARAADARPGTSADALPDAAYDLFLAPSDLTVIADYGALPDLPPLPGDVGVPRDAAPVETEGPPHLRLVPSALSLREGRNPVPLRVSLEGVAPSGPVAVTLAAEAGLTVEPAEVVLTADARTALVHLAAPVDADDEPTYGRVTASASGVAGDTSPFVVYDAHLTWEMQLDPEELAFVRASNDKTRRLVVENTLNEREVAPAEINLRGKGTLVCPRRSFTVRFQSPVHVQDSPPLEDVILIALCEDPLVLRSRVSLELLASVDLFPSWFSYVELRYGGETRGVYLMIERPRKAIEREHPENTRIIRRLTDADVEIDHPDEASIEDREAFLADYRALYTLRQALQGELLLAELQRRMQYDQYLLLLAYNSALSNGDNIDEIYFYDRTPPPNRPNAQQPFYTVMAWDQDEIFRNCHTPAPLNEPLTYCAESSLDRLVVSQAEIRALYVEQLRRLLEGPLSGENVERVTMRAAAELAVYLDRPGVRALHTVPDQPPPEALPGARTLLDLMAARREVLQPLLAAEPAP